MEKATSELWLQHITAYKESGLSKAEFCSQAGLHYQKFCFHCRRVEIAASAENDASAGNAFVVPAPAQLDITAAQLNKALACDSGSSGVMGAGYCSVERKWPQ